MMVHLQKALLVEPALPAWVLKSKHSEALLLPLHPQVPTHGNVGCFWARVTQDGLHKTHTLGRRLAPSHDSVALAVRDVDTSSVRMSTMPMLATSASDIAD